MNTLLQAESELAFLQHLSHYCPLNRNRVTARSRTGSDGGFSFSRSYSCKVNEFLICRPPVGIRTDSDNDPNRISAFLLLFPNGACLISACAQRSH
jgi:hypothetical protein